MKRWTICSLVAIVLGFTAAGMVGTDQTRVAPPPPTEGLAQSDLLDRAEKLFFESLNRTPDRRDEAICHLWKAWSANPSHGPTNLWLGLAYLWSASEGKACDPSALSSAIVAERMLTRAARLMPEDDRIVSWQSAVRYRLAEAEGDTEAAAAARAELLAASDRDPCFHSVALAIISFDRPRDSAEFKEGLAAMRRAASCPTGDPSVENRQRWPHNLEGFSLALAQYELKSGNRQRGEVMLMSLQERTSYARWPHRGLAEAQFESIKEAISKFADEDASNDPPLVIGKGSPVSCRICHEGAMKP